MNNISRRDTSELLRERLTQGRRAALSALQHYDVAWTAITFNQQSDTITFKIEAETDGSYLLRVHNEDRNIEEIRSEVSWLKALSAHPGLTVPQALTTHDDRCVVEYVTAQQTQMPVTLMHWIEGQTCNGTLNEQQIMSFGAMVARLHEASSAFMPPQDFKRPIWGAEAFKNQMITLGLYYERFLSTMAWDSYQRAAEKITAHLTTLAMDSHYYGMIHADLHMGNLIFQDDEPFPIDFGRCGYGHYLYDIAGALLGLSPHQRRQFLYGYERVRALAPNYSENLAYFFIMIMIENYCHHAPDPRETAGLLKEQPFAQAYLREFLNDTPFLFDAISPVEPLL